MTHEEKMAARLWAGAILTAPVYPAPDPEAPPSKHAGTWHAGPDGWKEWVEVGERWLARHRVEKFVIDILGDGQAPMWTLPPEYPNGVTVRRGWLYGQKATYVEGGGRSYLAAGWDTRLAVRDARRAWRRWAHTHRYIGVTGGEPCAGHDHGWMSQAIRCAQTRALEAGRDSYAVMVQRVDGKPFTAAEQREWECFAGEKIIIGED